MYITSAYDQEKLQIGSYVNLFVHIERCLIISTQLTVGSSSRAEKLAAFLDDKPKPFILSSERGFVTITGRCRGVPISIVSIGMGFPNMDFFVREMRETISGDMIVIRLIRIPLLCSLSKVEMERLGSCGAVADLPVSSVVVPEACVQISRNVDFDFANPGNNTEPAYRISKPVCFLICLS